MSRETDLAWAAGLLSGLGTFTTFRSNHSKSTSAERMAARLTLKSTHHTQALQRWADLMGVKAHPSRQNQVWGLKITISGAPLHKIMHALWDNLEAERKKEYAAVRMAARKANGE